MPALNFTGIHFENPFMLSSAPPTESESNILRAFDAGWGGVVTKTIGLHPVVNVYGAKAKFMRTSPETAGVSMKKSPNSALHSSWNWELISDKPIDWWEPRIRRIKEAHPDRVLIGVAGDAKRSRLFRVRAERRFDASGYVRYKRWRIYGERGVTRRTGSVWLFGETLTLAYDDETLAQYRVRYDSPSRRIAALTEARFFEGRSRSPQPFLWDLGDLDWHAVQRLPDYRERHKRAIPGEPLPLFSLESLSRDDGRASG